MCLSASEDNLFPGFPACLFFPVKSEDNLPVADYVMENTFWLGVYPGLSEEMLEFIFNETKHFIEENS